MQFSSSEGTTRRDGRSSVPGRDQSQVAGRGEASDTRDFQGTVVQHTAPDGERGTALPPELYDPRPEAYERRKQRLEGIDPDTGERMDQLGTMRQIGPVCHTHSSFQASMAAAGLDAGVLLTALKQAPDDSTVDRIHKRVTDDTRKYATQKAPQSDGAAYLLATLGPQSNREADIDTFPIGITLENVFNNKQNNELKDEISQLIAEQATTPAATQPEMQRIIHEYVNTASNMRSQNISTHTVSDGLREVDSQVQNINNLINDITNSRWRGDAEDDNASWGDGSDAGGDDASWEGDGHTDTGSMGGEIGNIDNSILATEKRSLEQLLPQERGVRDAFANIDHVLSTPENRQRILNRMDQFREQANSDPELTAIRTVLHALKRNRHEYTVSDKMIEIQESDDLDQLQADFITSLSRLGNIARINVGNRVDLDDPTHNTIKQGCSHVMFLNGLIERNGRPHVGVRDPERPPNTVDEVDVRKFVRSHHWPTRKSQGINCGESIYMSNIKLDSETIEKLTGNHLATE